MQVDKNCNATGAATQLGAIDDKQSNDADGKHKEIQPQQHLKNKHFQQQSASPLGLDGSNQVPSAATGAAASAPAGQTQSPNAANTNYVPATAPFDSVQQQHNVINRMITNIVQQNNGTKVHKIASESMIPKSRSGADSPHKLNSASGENAAVNNHNKHQPNNSTSFPNASKADGKNVV